MLEEQDFKKVGEEIGRVIEQNITPALNELKTRMATKEDLAGMATKEDLAGMATKEDLAGMATKEDLTGMATKEDLTGMATKEDLAGMATKEDLAGMATKEDLDIMASKLVTYKEFDEFREEVRREFADIREAISNLIAVVDKLAKAVDDLKIEYTIISRQVDRHEKWIQQIAEKVGVELKY